MTVRAVCGKCNNGWMASLEERAKEYLGPLFLNWGVGAVLRCEAQRTLAAWALKTAMMVEHTQGAERHVIPAEEYEQLHEHGVPSERIRIWMGAYGGTRALAVGRMWGLDADAVKLPDPDRGSRGIWGCTIVFGPTVFQVFGTTFEPLLQGLQVRAAKTHLIWPCERDFDWLPEPGLGDYEIVHFAEGLLNASRAGASRLVLPSRRTRRG